jgi:hypothetical protein
MAESVSGKMELGQKPLYGSGTGQSFDSDFMRCQRFFYWRHRQGVRLRQAGDGSALVVGHAGHAWMEAFYNYAGEPNKDEPSDKLPFAIAFADNTFEHALGEAAADAARLSLDVLDLEKRADTARTLLHALAPQFARRLERGEVTVGCEVHGTLELPQLWKSEREGGRKAFIGNNELRAFTVACDRLFYHPGDDPNDPDGMPVAGLALDEYKFTGMSSPRAYAEEQLLNDQSLGYLYWLDRFARTHLHLTEPVVGVRYRVFRVVGKIGAASYAEVWEPVNRAKLDDWYARKCALRAGMSAQWERPVEEWHAARYSFGPCRRFGRECAYWALCDEPGDEQGKIGEESDVGSTYVRMSPDEFEREKA